MDTSRAVRSTFDDNEDANEDWGKPMTTKLQTHQRKRTRKFLDATGCKARAKVNRAGIDERAGRRAKRSVPFEWKA